MTTFESLVALGSFRTIEIFDSLQSPGRRTQVVRVRISSTKVAFSDWIRAKVPLIPT